MGLLPLSVLIINQTQEPTAAPARNHSDELGQWLLKVWKEDEDRKNEKFLYGKIGKIVGLDDDEDMEEGGNTAATTALEFEKAKTIGWIKVIEILDGMYLDK
jgi:hypothetical protein